MHPRLAPHTPLIPTCRVRSFLLGESGDALYVAFMGTKLPRDMATNANLFQVSGGTPAYAVGRQR